MSQNTDCDSMRKNAIDAYIRCDRMHRCLFDKAVSGFGITRSQHMLLMCLSHKGGVMTQKELAQELGVSPAAVAAALKKLENAGYVARKASANDSRFNNTALTRRGQELVAITHTVFSGIDSRMFDGFSDSELSMMAKFNDRIVENLKEMAGQITRFGSEEQ